jgi:UDPglucose--hexose-1-phosphate uridylyltransferase
VASHTQDDGGSELRRNPVNGKLTIIAPGRATRPTDLLGERSAGDSGLCPFCAGNEALTPQEVDAFREPGSAPDGPGWRVRVVPNKYPALPGMHEVIVHSPDHVADLEDLDDEGLVEVLEMWRRRIAAQFDSGAVAATLIVNHGAEAGASLAHPHAQLFATPVVPPLLLDELLAFDRHRERYGGCVLCAEMAAAGGRLVFGGEIVAWVPAATRFASELWMAPAAHQSDIREADLTPLAPALRRALAAVIATTGDAALNLWLHTAPAEPRGNFHWHFELAPRVSGIAGFELATDMAIVSIDPEAAAAALRKALSPA